MKKLKKFLTSSFFHLLLLYIIEIAATVFMLVYLNGALKDYQWYSTLGYALKVFTFLMFLHVVFIQSMDYAYRVNWILLFLISPTFGGLIYFFISRKRPLPKKWQKFYRYRKEYREEREKVREREPNKNYEELKSTDENAYRTALYIKNNALVPLSSHTRSEFLYPGENAWAKIKEDLKNAKNYIYLEFYIIENGTLYSEIKEILFEKIESGVDVKVLFDDMGCINKVSRKMLGELEAHGIKWSRFNPVKLHLDSNLNFRNHRKIVVIDGIVSYTGGINLADEYINVNSPFGKWFDSGVRLAGEGTEALLVTFLKDWWFATGEVLTPPIDVENNKPKVESDGFVQFYPDSPFDREPIAKNVFLSIISNAKDYMYIATPYIALDDETMNAIILAAASGVDVRIAVPGIPDKKIVYTITKSHFEKLIKNNVKIYTYTPGFLHAKLLLSDDKVASVGSVNLDYRSFFLNFECGVALYDTSSIKDVRASFEELFKESKQIGSTYKDTAWFKIKYSVIKFLTPFF